MAGIAQTDHLFARMATSFSSGNLALDEHSWEIVKSQALQKARALQENVARVAVGSSHSLSNLRIPPGLRSRSGSRDSIEYERQQYSPTQNPCCTSPILNAFARVFVILYFLNLVYEDYMAWSFLQSPDMQERIRLYPGRFPSASFPYFKVFVMLPCAILSTTQLPVRWLGLVLPAQIGYSYGWRMWQQLNAMLEGTGTMDELMAKKLAVGGAVVLLLACQKDETSTPQHRRMSSYAGATRPPSAPQHRRMSSYPGLLVMDSGGGISRRKSVVLLVARLLMSTLFIFAGSSQVSRVLERDLVLWRRHSWGPQDAHDNNWLLLQLLLALPFMLGYRMQWVCRALSATLALEALTCWPFFLHRYPSWHIAMHVRGHFFTNTAVAGGLLLLQSHGAGCFTLDAFMNKKKEL